MTRDEAQQKAHSALDIHLDLSHGSGIRKDLAVAFVDMAVALGMLKLDETPKTFAGRIDALAQSLGLADNMHPDDATAVMLKAADALGLKIVPK